MTIRVSRRHAFDLRHTAIVVSHVAKSSPQGITKQRSNRDANSNEQQLRTRSRKERPRIRNDVSSILSSNAHPPSPALALTLQPLKPSFPNILPVVYLFSCIPRCANRTQNTGKAFDHLGPKSNIFVHDPSSWPVSW